MMKVTKDENRVISVIVPTHGRVKLLRKLLISLQRASSNCNVPIEIIVVDSSPVDQQSQIKQLCQDFGGRYLSGPQNVRRKRNMGIRESTGEIVLFVDSDCEVSENIFIEHLKLYNEKDTAGVLGVTEFVGEENVTWKIVERTKFLDAFLFAKTLGNYLDSAPWGTCTNLSFRKEVLEQIGGFDTDFPFRLGGDDTEFGIRVNKAGYKIKMNPDAVVYHTRETWSSFLAVTKRVFRWGRVDYHVYYKKHKDKIAFTFPKPITIFYFMLICGFIETIMNNLLLGLSLPFAWLLLFLFLNSLFKIISLRDSLKSLFLELPAQFLHFLFDFGNVLESIKNKNLAAFFKCPLDNPRQIIVLWGERVREAWSVIVSTLSILLIFMVV
jgi:GT2 family glycosyltransferase